MIALAKEIASVLLAGAVLGAIGSAIVVLL